MEGKGCGGIYRNPLLAHQVWGRDGRPPLLGRTGRSSPSPKGAFLERRSFLTRGGTFSPPLGGGGEEVPRVSLLESEPVACGGDIPRVSLCLKKSRGRGYLMTNLWEITYPVRDSVITRFLMPRSGRVQQVLLKQ